MNNTIKAMDYNWTPGPEIPNNQDAGGPKAIFIPHSNSLPFDERRVTLDQPVKVIIFLNSTHNKLINEYRKTGCRQGSLQIEVYTHLRINLDIVYHYNIKSKRLLG